MSYILDALRRANAERERERGAVPSLHTQQYGALPGDEDDAPRRSRVTVAVMTLLATGLLAVLAWHFLGSDRAAPVVAQAMLPAPLPVPLPVPPSPALLAPAIPAPQSVAAPAPSTAPAAGVAGSTASVRSAARPTKPAARAAAPAATASAADERTAASSAGNRIYAIAELPEDVRRDLPKLSFGGASYSNDAASRMVIVNGQVFHEGDTIARGLVLQRVNRKSAVLAFRGYRYELGF